MSSPTLSARSMGTPVSLSARRDVPPPPALAIPSPGSFRSMSDTVNQQDSAADTEFRALFQTIDEDGSGAIDIQELQGFFEGLEMAVGESELARILGDAGEITEQDFVDLMFRLRSDHVALLDQEATYWDAAGYGAEKRVFTRWDARKAKLWELMEFPRSSGLATFIMYSIMTCIFISTVAFVIESELRFHRRHETTFNTIELVTTVVFTMELVLRLLSTPSRPKFFRTPLNIVDIVAVAPFYLELALNEALDINATSIRVVRLVRVFRLFKVSRYLRWLKVFEATLRSSGPPLAMIAFVNSIIVVVLSSIMYFLERGTWDESMRAYVKDGQVSAFQSIPQTLWWAVTTMTTIGFGDQVPTTTGGRFVAGITSMSGVLLLSIPIAVISSAFRNEHLKKSKAMAVMAAQEEKLQGSQFTVADAALVNMRSTLELARGNRHRLLGSLKQLELSSREDLVTDVSTLVDDMAEMHYDEVWGTG